MNRIPLKDCCVLIVCIFLWFVIPVNLYASSIEVIELKNRQANEVSAAIKPFLDAGGV